MVHALARIWLLKRQSTLDRRVSAAAEIANAMQQINNGSFVVADCHHRTMVDPSSVKMWHSVRRSLALAALAVWLPLGLATSIGLVANLTDADRVWSIAAPELIARYLTPILFATVGAAFAIGVLRTAGPGSVTNSRLAGCGLLCQGLSDLCGGVCLTDVAVFASDRKPRRPRCAVSRLAQTTHRY